MGHEELDLVRHALSVAQRAGCAEVELAHGSLRFAAKLDAVPAAPRSAVSGEPQIPVEEPSLEIVSTLVGYYRPVDPPLAPGQKVERGQVVAVVAALGIANEIESKLAGEVVEVLVEPDQPVEFGQPLAKLKSGVA